MWLMALVLATAVPVDGPLDRVPPSAAATAPEPVSRSVLEERSLRDLLGSDEERAAVVRAMSGPSVRRRRAALAAVGAHFRPDAVESRRRPEQALDVPPEGTLAAALDALRSEDPLLRDAAVSALVACGQRAMAALARLERGETPEGLPAVPAQRARHAALEVLRYHVERRFLGLWGPDDGSFKDMFGELRQFGSLSSHVLLGIALDQRVVAGEDLRYGPYTWRCPVPRDRKREDVRYRALDALGDCGDEQVRERLRMHLRRRPAPELLDDTDEDPVPASWDDALRHAICAMGDARPVFRITQVPAPGNWYSRTVEMKRRASAFIRIAQYSNDPEVRVRNFDEAERLMREAMRHRAMGGIGVDAGEYYNLACLLAQRDGPGDREDALDQLQRAVDAGYSVTSEWCARDGDLTLLREEPRFQELLKRLRNTERALRQQME